MILNCYKHVLQIAARMNSFENINTIIIPVLLWPGFEVGLLSEPAQTICYQCDENVDDNHDDCDDDDDAFADDE